MAARSLPRAPMWSRVRRLLAVALCVAAFTPVGGAATPALAQAFPPSSPCSVAPTTGAVQDPEESAAPGAKVQCKVVYAFGQDDVANVFVAVPEDPQQSLPDPTKAAQYCDDGKTQPMTWKAVPDIGAVGYRGQCPEPTPKPGETIIHALTVTYLFQRGACVVAGLVTPPGEPKLVPILKQIDQAIQAAPTGNVCAGQAPTRAEVRVFSTPKQRADYRFEVAIPAMVPDRQGAPTFDQLYDQKLGKLELRLTYQAGKDGPTKQVSFSWPMAALVATSDQDRERLAQDGQTYFVDRARLLVLYRTLDQLEPLASDPANALDTPAPGEARFRGGELLFKRELYLSDDKGPVAHSNPNNSLFLRYVVRYPVVFLPGTAGSVLTVNGSQVWPANANRRPDTAANRQFWGQLALDAQGRGLPGLAVAATDVFRSYAVCNDTIRKGCVYQRWIAHMGQQGYAEGRNLLLFPYDWRLRTDSHVGALDQLVERARNLNYNRGAVNWDDPHRPTYQPQPGDKVILVSHSQGGLVTRAYVADDSRAAKVAQAILLGAPNFGTLKPFRLLGAYGYNFEADIFLGLEMAKWMGRNLPAAYYQMEVTPTGAIQPFLFDAQGRPVPDVRAALAALRTHVFCATYVQNSVGCQEATLNMDLLDAATRFHASLPSPADKGIPTFSINSVDRMTPIAYRQATRDVSVKKVTVGRGFSGAIPHDVMAKYGLLPADVFAQDSYQIVSNNTLTYTVRLPYYLEVQAQCGDNLVPLHSLDTLRGSQNVYVAGVEHGGYTEDETVQQHIDRLLQGVRPAGLPRPPCVSQPSPVEQAIGISEEGSPANLHVYDAQGRHTGLAADGSIEESIPGSTFETSGPNQEVRLPWTTQPVRIVLQGVATTAFNLRIVAGDGKSETSVSYLDVPETATMRGEVQLNPSGLGKATVLTVTGAGGSGTQTHQPDDVQTFTAAGGNIAPTPAAASPIATSGGTPAVPPLAPTTEAPPLGLHRDAEPAPTQTSPGTGGAGQSPFPRPDIVALGLVRAIVRRFGAIAIAIVAGALLVIPFAALRGSHRGPRPGSGPVNPGPAGSANAAQRRGTFCTKCGARTSGNARFCTRCGHAL